MVEVVMTVDLEPDCPPYLQGWRGMRDGAPRLLDLLDDADVPATLFTTGEAAGRFPGLVEDALRRGHELACHGWSHRPFPRLGPEEAEEEIRRSAGLLRDMAGDGAVTAFRAPFLSFPEAYLCLLEDHGFRLDASRSRYKPAHWIEPARPSSLRRLDASVTSSFLRFPAPLRDPVLRRLDGPVVLFVHPWEFVDLTGEELRWDCRFRTGQPALEDLRSALAVLRDRGARFVRAREVTA